MTQKHKSFGINFCVEFAAIWTGDHKIKAKQVIFLSAIEFFYWVWSVVMCNI